MLPAVVVHGAAIHAIAGARLPAGVRPTRSRRPRSSNMIMGCEGTAALAIPDHCAMYLDGVTPIAFLNMTMKAVGDS
jgi:hypothetical protein